jgi:DNA-binding SARP family transcriptional activator/tetratricopeptide (TPR) repeat protein
MQVWLCGRFRVSDGGVSIEDRLERRQARSLAAFLVLNRARPVSREQLIAALWPEAGEGQRDAALRVLLTSVRRVFGADSLQGRTEVRLELPEGTWIDVEAAEADVAAAEQALARGEQGTSASHARAAAELLQAPLLAGEGAPWIDEARRALDDLAVRALEFEAEAELAGGNPRDAERAARALVARAPFREAGHVLVMQALEAQGNTAQALLAYERVRALLRDELGTTPSRALSDLHARLLAGDVPVAPAPVAASAGLPPASVHPALPVALAPADGVHFVGREAELEALKQAWQIAKRGSRRIVLVAGEPGIGKTSLVGELAAEAHAEGGIVLYGRCDEDVGFAFQPFVEALRAYVAACPPDVVRAQAGRGAAELARVLPELAELMPDAVPPARPDAALDQYLMFEAVINFLAEVSRTAPLLLVLDDLHWAARPTLLLLRHLVRSPPAMQVCVVGTFRDTELPRSHPLLEMLADLRREPGIERHALAGLSAEQVEDLLALEVDVDLDPKSRTLARTVHEETRGNPFFVGEILRQVADSRERLASSGELSLEQLGIPEGVREVVSRRLMRLSEGATQVLTVAAVAGPSVTLPLLERVPDASRSPDALLDALDEAVRARVLVESDRLPGRYAFTHALVRQAVYIDLTAARRGRLHRQVAAALEDLYRDEIDQHLHELAHHFAQAAPGEEDKAIEYLMRAGNQAQTKLAYDQALTHYRQAFELLEAFGDTAHLRRRCEVTIALGEAQRRAGYRTFRDTLLDGARLAAELGDAELLSRAALANNRGFFSSTGEVDTERVRCLEEALAAYDPAPSPTRARLLAQLGVELIFGGDWELRCRYSEEAVAMARSIEDPGTLAVVLMQRVATIWHAGTLQDRIECAAEAAGIARELDDPLLTYYAAAYAALAALEDGDIAAADVALERQNRLATTLRQPILRWYDLVTRAKRELMAGSVAEADRLATKGFEAGQEAGQPDAFLLFAAQLMVIRMHQGRLGELADALAAAPRRTGRSRTVPLLTQAYLTTIYCELGRLEEARIPYERLMARDLADVSYDFSWLPVIALAAAACATLEDTDRADRLIELLEPYRDGFVDMGSSWLGPVSRYLGLLYGSLGRTSEAEECFRSAIASQRALAARPWLAQTQLDYARMLRARGRPEDLVLASELSGEALELGRVLGLDSILRHADVGA